jgi:hypothetical protein
LWADARPSGIRFSTPKEILMKILVSIFVLMIAIATLAQAEEPCRSVADACVDGAADQLDAM